MKGNDLLTEALFNENRVDITGTDKDFNERFNCHSGALYSLYDQLYKDHPKKDEALTRLVQNIINAYKNRPQRLVKLDKDKEARNHWFLSNNITGMSLYVDRFCGDLKQLPSRLDYLQELGVNLLHLMPIFQSPAGHSDGGYAVSDFRKIDERFGTLEDLKIIEEHLQDRDMYLMLDIVLNHTSHHHQWAEKAKKGDPYYQDYFYFFKDRSLPDAYESSMPEIFPESAPGNFTYVPECAKWVMTVFHTYQWDLNYTNPLVLADMIDTIFFYANIGVDILRIDAPAFIWKQLGTACQNLPEAHTILRLIKKCVQIATPGMALLGEAIVAPNEIMKYFGEGDYRAQECDFAYNATDMALRWDALASGDTRVMLAAQSVILNKPEGTSWITYTRCHDDIGLGYDDYMIESAGFNPYEHRKFLKNYYSGVHYKSPAKGALFSVNPKTQDARISGSLASLCGLERALRDNDESDIELSLKKIILMQAHSFFIGGIPMIFYGDEAGYTNDYSFLDDKGKSYDNRWMHRPLIDWSKNKKAFEEGSIENAVFTATKRLICLRKKLEVVADHSNLIWLPPHNIHVAAFLRKRSAQMLYCIFNFRSALSYLTWYAFKEHGIIPVQLYDHWQEKTFEVGPDHDYLVMEPYTFFLLEPVR